MTKVPQADRTRLTRLKKKLETRIDIVSSAIDLIKLVAARGNTNLESTLRLTHDLKEEIDEFDERVREIIEDENAGVEQVKEIEEYMADLLERIEEAIPLINLALTTSGANLNGSLPSQVSPGRLLQASDLVNKSNSVFDGSKDLLVGHIFQLTLYSIFYHRGRMVNSRLDEISWKEEYTKADVSIWRVKSDNKYEYLLKIKENFDDGRYHEEEDPKEIKLDVSTITRLFFSASGKLLKLEDRSTPVLVLKINKSFGLEETEQENLVEWLAFGEYEQLYESDSESEDSEEEEKGTEHKSLSLLEYMLRLCVLQANDQQSILTVDDERLNLYLQDENRTSFTTETTESLESESSTPVKIIERKSKTPIDLTNRLKKMSVEETPTTPMKSRDNESRESPLPGEKETNIMTPWEKDKLSKMVEQTPLRKSVWKKSIR